MDEDNIGKLRLERVNIRLNDRCIRHFLNKQAQDNFVNCFLSSVFKSCLVHTRMYNLMDSKHEAVTQYCFNVGLGLYNYVCPAVMGHRRI